MVSACMSGTRGSGVLSSACDVLAMSVVRGVGGVCDMCMCLALSVVGGAEWVRGLRLGFTNPGGTGGSGICVCVLVTVVWVVLGEWVGSLGQGLGSWCGVRYVFVVSLDSLC